MGHLPRDVTGRSLHAVLTPPNLWWDLMYGSRYFYRQSLPHTTGQTAARGHLK